MLVVAATAAPTHGTMEPEISALVLRPLRRRPGMRARAPVPIRPPRRDDAPRADALSPGSATMAVEQQEQG